MRTLMVKENLFMYSNNLHIFYVLLQCNVNIMSLNHYLMYVAKAINYQYVLFHINVQHIFYYHIKNIKLRNNLRGKIIIIIAVIIYMFTPFIMSCYYSY
jgi:hypothetical protein